MGFFSIIDNMAYHQALKLLDRICFPFPVISSYLFLKEDSTSSIFNKYTVFLNTVNSSPRSPLCVLFK